MILSKVKTDVSFMGITTVDSDSCLTTSTGPFTLHKWFKTKTKGVPNVGLV